MTMIKTLSGRTTPRLRPSRSLWDILVDWDRDYRTRRALEQVLRDPHLARDIGLPHDPEPAVPTIWRRVR